MYNPYENNNQNNQNENRTPNRDISSWNTYQPNGGDGNNFFYQSPQDPQPEKTAAKKKSGAPKYIALFLAGILVSGAVGFGGSMVAQKYFSDSNGSGPAVIKQSVVNTSTNDGKTATVSDIASATANTVVEITTEVVTRNQFMQQFTSTGAGSGVVITADGYIITNNHVISGASTIKVTMRDGTQYDATLVGADAESDIAVIKIDAKDLETAVLGDSDTLTVGELAVAIGNPLGQLGGTVTDGIISALDREITIDGQTMHLLQTSAAINPGNSGGGLFNEKGELVGIVNAKTSEAGIEGLGFAIPINTAQKVAEQLITNGYVTGKVRLGVSLLDIADAQTAMQYGVTDPGVYVSQVTANSDAYYGGLKAADRIKSVNGKEVTTSQEVKDVISNSSVGDKLTMVVVRGNEEQTLEITLTEYNSSAEKFAG